MLAGLLKSLFPSRDAEQLVRARLEAWDAWLQPLSETGCRAQIAVHSVTYKYKNALAVRHQLLARGYR